MKFDLFEFFTDLSNDEWEAKIKATRHKWEKHVRVDEGMLREMFVGGVFGRSCIKANMNVPETERCKDLVERVLHAESKDIMPVAKPRTACIVFIDSFETESCRHCVWNSQPSDPCTIHKLKGRTK